MNNLQLFRENHLSIIYNVWFHTIYNIIVDGLIELAISCYNIHGEYCFEIWISAVVVIDSDSKFGGVFGEALQALKINVLLLAWGD